MKNKISILIFLFTCLFSYAQIPTGYYNGTSGLVGDSLKTKLYDIIKGHTQKSYSSLWTHLRITDEDPNDNTKVVLLYKGTSYLKTSNGGNVNDWNREHVWAKSHGGFGTTPPAGTDLHHIRPTDVSVNSSRGNLDFDNGGSAHTEATLCKFDSDSWEPRDAVKGDVARMLFYMATRYEGVGSEPDLELNYKVGNGTAAFHGKLDILLTWHSQDTVDSFEKNRNDEIYSIQGNRNPYIDHPEFAEMIFDTSYNSITSIKPEPIGSFSRFTMLKSMKISWKEPTTGTLPDGYLIKFNSTDISNISSPIDGVEESGKNIISVPFGTNTITVDNLESGKTYYFKVFSFSNSGTSIDYLTTGAIPNFTVTVP